MSCCQCESTTGTVEVAYIMMIHYWMHLFHMPAKEWCAWKDGIIYDLNRVSWQMSLKALIARDTLGVPAYYKSQLALDVNICGRLSSCIMEIPGSPYREDGRIVSEADLSHPDITVMGESVSSAYFGSLVV